MGWARVVAFVLAGAAAALFVAGLVLALFPPQPDCDEGGRLRCEKEAYERLAGRILLGWLGGITLLVGAGGAWMAHLRQRRSRPPAPRKSPRTVVSVTTQQPGRPRGR